MLGLMFQKMWQKKWMNLCLLLGCILLIATVVSFPLYEKAAYDRMLTDEFKNYIANEGIYPAMISMRTVSQKDKGGKTITKIEKKMTDICDEFSVTEKDSFNYYILQRSPLLSEFNRPDDKNIGASLGFMTNLYNHIDLLSGELPSEKGVTDDGQIEVIVTQGCLVNLGLLVGETLTFENLKLPDGEKLSVVIKGVFQPNYDDPFYWQMEPNVFRDVFFINEDLFRDKFTEENAGKYNIYCYFYTQFNYEDLVYDQVNDLMSKTKYLKKKSKFKSVTEDSLYYDLLDNYMKKINRISATLLILQIPVLIMLAAFLLMISSQMYEMEKNEISVIKSRGSSRFQIFKLYLYQGILLTMLGAAFGIPLGGYFAKALGAARSFLEFDSGRMLVITYTKRSFMYALVSMAVTLLSITLPAISHSKVSIVNLKQSKNAKKKSLWQKLYLDVVLLAISGYGYFSFNKSMSSISGDVLSGKSLDPLLYISSSLFIIGMGLMYIRLQPLIVRLIFRLTKNVLRPASYISYMEAIKQSGKQQLIILFLIMTVSLGMYHSTVARTILDNAVANTEYTDGCDLVIKERWKSVMDENGVFTGNFVEPDFKKFVTMDFAEKYTRVYFDDAGYVSEGKNKNQIVTLMGIHTREFGEMTYIESSYLSKPYYELLNELADDSGGIIVSENFKTKLGYEVGDTVFFHNAKKQTAGYKIVDFFEYFPSYSPQKTVINPDGNSETIDNYLIVGHFEKLMRDYGMKPYEVWASLKPDATTEQIHSWIEANKVRVDKYVNKRDDVESTISDPLLQGTNGVLTLGFVVTLILCAVGYLIYWIMSIKDRELIFGVLRASGFHKGEIVHMLINEQIFSGILSVFAGIGIGYVSSRLFVPIIQLSYASSSQILPLRMVMNYNDQIRMFTVVGIAMLACLVTLITLLFRMNVTKALKLGEE